MLGILLFYLALRVIRLRKNGQQVLRTIKILGLQHSKAIDFDRLCLVRAAFGNRHPRIWYAIYGYRNDSKFLIANEQDLSLIHI